MELWITFGFFGKSALFGEKNDAQRLFFCKKFVDFFLVDKFVEKMCISGKPGGDMRKMVNKNYIRMNKNKWVESYPQKLWTLWITLSTDGGQTVCEKRKKGEERKKKGKRRLEFLFKHCVSDVIIEAKMRKRGAFIGIFSPDSNRTSALRWRERR